MPTEEALALVAAQWEQHLMATLGSPAAAGEGAEGLEGGSRAGGRASHEGGEGPEGERSADAPETSGGSVRRWGSGMALGAKAGADALAAGGVNSGASTRGGLGGCRAGCAARQGERQGLLVTACCSR
jgi:hypothetical protein